MNYKEFDYRVKKSAVVVTAYLFVCMNFAE
jgi:hypothetical protein